MNRRLLPGALLILALVLRAAIPDGFMPAIGKAGLAHMMICPGMAGMNHGDAAGKDGKSGGHANCPYSPVLVQGLAGYIPAVISTPVRREAVPAFLTDSLLDPVAVKPWLSQGPPSLLTI
jgi:hypothetical protein